MSRSATPPVRSRVRALVIVQSGSEGAGVASTHFQKLDEESRALAERRDQMIRVALVVALIATATWAACASVRAAVHFLSELVIGGAESGTYEGEFVLVAALLGGAVARTLLYRRPGWREASGDGMSVALENY